MDDMEKGSTGVGLLISLTVTVVVVVVFVAVVAVVVVAGGLLLLSTDIVRGCRVAAIVLKWRGGKYVPLTDHTSDD